MPHRRRCAVSGDRRAVVFSDDGPGIPGRGWRGCSSRGRAVVASTRRRRSGGRVRGLGLAIAKRLCDLQGWQLAIQSPVEGGRGTAFTVLFEAAPAAS